MKEEDGVDLARGDFRRIRRYLTPRLFAWPDDDEPQTYPPPSDLIPEERWDHVMTLPTDVALKSSSYEGSAIARLAALESQWIFSWPEVGEAPFMEEVALLADEEFDALVFNALHGYLPTGHSAFYSAVFARAVRRAGAYFSVTARMDPKVRAAIGSIGADAWTPTKYPRALWDDQLRAWVSEAEVAEVAYTAFTSKKGQAIAAQLIVRRVKGRNRHHRRGPRRAVPGLAVPRRVHRQPLQAAASRGLPAGRPPLRPDPPRLGHRASHRLVGPPGKRHDAPGQKPRTSRKKDEWQESHARHNALDHVLPAWPQKTIS